MFVRVCARIERVNRDDFNFDKHIPHEAQRLVGDCRRNVGDDDGITDYRRKIREQAVETHLRSGGVDDE